MKKQGCVGKHREGVWEGGGSTYLDGHHRCLIVAGGQQAVGVVAFVGLPIHVTGVKPSLEDGRKEGRY